LGSKSCSVDLIWTGNRAWGESHRPKAISYGKRACLSVADALTELLDAPWVSYLKLVALSGVRSWQERSAPTESFQEVGSRFGGNLVRRASGTTTGSKTHLRWRQGDEGAANATGRHPLKPTAATSFGAISGSNSRGPRSAHDLNHLRQIDRIWGGT
jgi:hypothetical protein